jgi:hypothetical protein
MYSNTMEVSLILPFLGKSASDYIGPANSCINEKFCAARQVRVAICLQVNTDSVIYVQVGCKPTPDGEVRYSDAPGQTTWSSCLRTVKWIRNVPADSYLRIRVCAKDAGCGAGSCEPPPADLIPQTNKLVRMIVDGMDITEQLQNMLDTQTYSCRGVTIGCQAALTPGTSDCCHNGATVLFTELLEMPQGAQIELGPLNSTFVVYCG